MNVDLLALELQHNSLLLYTSLFAPPASLLWKMWPNNPPTWGGGGGEAGTKAQRSSDIVSR